MRKKQWFEESRFVPADEIRSYPGIIFMGLCFVIGLIVLIGIW